MFYGQREYIKFMLKLAETLKCNRSKYFHKIPILKTSDNLRHPIKCTWRHTLDYDFPIQRPTFTAVNIPVNMILMDSYSCFKT